MPKAQRVAAMSGPKAKALQKSGRLVDPKQNLRVMMSYQLQSNEVNYIHSNAIAMPELDSLCIPPANTASHAAQIESL